MQFKKCILTHSIFRFSEGKPCIKKWSKWFYKDEIYTENATESEQRAKLICPAWILMLFYSSDHWFYSHTTRRHHILHTDSLTIFWALRKLSLTTGTVPCLILCWFSISFPSAVVHLCKLWACFCISSRSTNRTGLQVQNELMEVGPQ